MCCVSFPSNAICILLSQAHDQLIRRWLGIIWKCHISMLVLFEGYVRAASKMVALPCQMLRSLPNFQAHLFACGRPRDLLMGTLAVVWLGN